MNNDHNDTLAYTQLRFSVDVPDLEETWLDGYQAGMHESPEESNPYAMGTKEYEFWNEGWWAGYYQEEPLFNLAGQVNEAAVVANKEQTAVAKEGAVESKSPGKYIIKTIQILGALLAAAVCYQLADLVV